MKRILSIILTLSIVATLFAGLGLNASATNAPKEGTAAEVPVPTSESMVESYSAYYYNGTDRIPVTMLNPDHMYDSNLTNGTSDGSKMQFGYDDGGEYKYYDNVYADIVLKLKGNIQLSDVYVAHKDSATWITREYALYIGSNEGTLFDGEPYYICDNSDSKQVQHYTFSDKTARFVGIRITKACDGSATYSPNLWYPRIVEFNAFGTPVALPTYEVTYKVDDQDYDVQTVEKGADAVPPAAPTKTGYTFTGWDHDGKGITADTIINAKFEIKTCTVTFKVDGEVVKTQKVEWNTGATAPEVADKYGYTFAWNKDFANVKEDLEVNGAYTLKANAHTIKFESVTGKPLGEVIVVQGDAPNLAEVQAINAKVEAIAIYGYTVKKDGDNVVWDQNVYGNDIVSNITVRPLYEAIEDLRTKVTVFATDGKTVHYEKLQRYDTVINLDVPNAQSYEDEEGNVLVATATAQLFACGKEMNIYAKKDAAEAPEVAIVGKDHKDYKGFSIFAHVNVENATEYGIIFANSKAGANKDFTLKSVAADTEKTKFTTIKIDATNVGQADFMGTLNYKKDKNPTRYARAYVIVGDVEYYSNVVINK